MKSPGRKKKSGAFRKGRIPHSRWFEFKLALNKNGFLPAEELRQLFNRHGVTAEHQIITYCQSGVRSANTLFVLKELLHYPQVSNYDGSWIEWSWYKQLPIEAGQPSVLNSSP